MSSGSKQFKPNLRPMTVSMGALAPADRRDFRWRSRRTFSAVVRY